jgi:hypothetical protein
MAGEYEVQFVVEGYDDVRAALRHATREVLKELTRGMVENVEDLLGRGMRRAPVDEGTLRGSGSARVNQTEVAHTEGAGTDHRVVGSSVSPPIKAQIEGEVGFNTPYAAVQHEHVEFRHPQGGEALYLVNPLKEMTSRYVENLAEHVRGVTR